jgi:tetratricopeptide (TPR) repeat protein
VTGPLKVFLSYAHEDEAYRETLGKHLSAIEREGLIEIWHDRQITGGREWAGAIDQALKSADIVVLLISADFLNSDYCNDVELGEAIRMHDAGQARVVPVILRSCDWEKSKFARFNALPPDGLPVVEAEHPDQRFKAVAKGLRAIVGELTASPSGAGPAGTSAGLAGPEPVSPASRTITISKLSLFGVAEIGPFELRWPPRIGVRTALVGLAAVAGVLAMVVGGTYAFALRGPLADAREAMRMARYDSALDSVASVPRWLAAWPAVVAMRKKAELGAGFQSRGQDWEILARDLDRQLAVSPGDADLLVLQATNLLRKGDFDNARLLVERALKADEKNAEAWFLLGFDAYLAGDTAAATSHYRKAADAAPESPQYGSSLARALLDTGKVDASLKLFRTISQFPLARVEQALAHWAKGEMREAADAQRDTVKMLDDPTLMDRFYNRRGWVFRLPHKGIILSRSDDKRCYALLGESASRTLAGDTATAFPPPTCSAPPLEIRELVADDLCRFVDLRQPGLAAAVESLRQALGQAETCPTTAAP